MLASRRWRTRLPLWTSASPSLPENTRCLGLLIRRHLGHEHERNCSQVCAKVAGETAQMPHFPATARLMGTGLWPFGERTPLPHQRPSPPDPPEGGPGGAMASALAGRPGSAHPPPALACRGREGDRHQGRPVQEQQPSWPPWPCSRVCPLHRLRGMRRERGGGRGLSGAWRSPVETGGSRAPADAAPLLRCRVFRSAPGTRGGRRPSSWPRPHAFLPL